MTDEARGLDIRLGTLDVPILETLSWGPSHGYGIARWIGKSSGETFRVLEARSTRGRPERHAPAPYRRRCGRAAGDTPPDFWR